MLHLYRLLLLFPFLFPTLASAQAEAPSSRTQWVAGLSHYRSYLLHDDPAAAEAFQQLLIKWRRNGIPGQDQSNFALNSLYAAEVYGRGYKGVMRLGGQQVPGSAILSHFTEADLETIRKNALLLDLIWLTALTPDYPFVIDARTELFDELAVYDIRPGERLAEIGAGTGSFSLMLNHLYPDNELYANEIDWALRRYLERRLVQHAGFFPADKLHLVRGRKKSVNLDEPVDKIIVRKSYHHWTERAEMLASVREALLPGGRLYILEPTTDLNEPGEICELLLSREEIIESVTAGGFALERTVSFDYRDLLVFTVR